MTYLSATEHTDSPTSEEPTMPTTEIELETPVVNGQFIGVTVCVAVNLHVLSHIQSKMVVLFEV